MNIIIDWELAIELLAPSVLMMVSFLSLWFFNSVVIWKRFVTPSFNNPEEGDVFLTGLFGFFLAIIEVVVLALFIMSFYVMFIETGIVRLG